MDNHQNLQRIKARLGLSSEDTSQDTQIIIRSQDAADYFCAYCRRTKIPIAATGLIERLTIWLLQTPLHVQSEKIGDTSVTYKDDALPDDLRRELNRYRRIGVG